MTRRRLTDEERRLWQRYTAGVDKLRQTTAPTEPGPAPEKADTAATGRRQPTRLERQASRPTQVEPTRPALSPDSPVNTDRRTWDRLRRGQIAIERRLDLHGRSQAEAHEALARFLTAAATAGYRCVLIVTGKGVGGQGVLRQMVPRWLAEEGNRDHVVTYCKAQPRHGGDGALYVLIRRRRPSVPRRSTGRTP